MSTDSKGILIESGTNELEIVTFTIGLNLFSINVMKVKEIVHSSEVTKVPETHPAIEGILQIRGEVLPVINLAQSLGIESRVSNKDSKFIITELNDIKIVFRVDEVHRIKRISWQQIEEPSSLSMGLEKTTAGIVKLDGQIILMLDYEKLVHEISPNKKMIVNNSALLEKEKEKRKEKRIYIAEDSAMLRQTLQGTLESAGYVNLTFFKNGEDALHQIEALAKANNVSNNIDLLITDIEMPKMDGHHLTKRVKENEFTKHLPIIIFSSLISNELKHKGSSVGADAQITKPELEKLINEIDRLIL